MVVGNQTEIMLTHQHHHQHQHHNVPIVWQANRFNRRWSLLNTCMACANAKGDKRFMYFCTWYRKDTIKTQQKKKRWACGRQWKKAMPRHRNNNSVCSLTTWFARGWMIIRSKLYWSKNTGNNKSNCSLLKCASNSCAQWFSLSSKDISK